MKEAISGQRSALDALRLRQMNGEKMSFLELCVANTQGTMIAGRAAAELADLRAVEAERETYRLSNIRMEELHVKLLAERDAYRNIVKDVSAGNYDNAHDITAARKYIYNTLDELGLLEKAALGQVEK